MKNIFNNQTSAIGKMFVPLLSAILLLPIPSPAAVIPPGELLAVKSGDNLLLSFATTNLDLYLLQISPDLEHWTNSAIMKLGDGNTDTVIVTNAFAGGQSYYQMSILTPIRLLLPQSTAFSFLGHSCGGIQEQVSAGFDVTNGYPAGVVSLLTRCGGSGRGGGYHVTTYTAAVWVTWDFAGNAISATILTNTPDLTTDGDGLGDVIINAGSLAYLYVPVPQSPIITTVSQTGDQLQVAWTPHGVNPLAITSSTLTATPVSSTNPVLTATVPGTSTSGVILSVEPQTTYQITVVNSTIGGSGHPSVPVEVTTAPATIPPSAPTAVSASWTNPDPSGTTDTIAVTWQVADPGNSPVDQYLITITGSNGAGTFTQTVDGTTLSASFSVDYIPNWSVKVQAHNAAGWGPVSTSVKLGGL